MTLFTRIEDHHKSPIYEPTGLLILKLNTYTTIQTMMNISCEATGRL